MLSPSTAASAVPTPRSSLRALLARPNDLAVGAMRALLSRIGCQVTAATGDAQLDGLLSIRWDVIVVSTSVSSAVTRPWRDVLRSAARSSPDAELVLVVSGRPAELVRTLRPDFTLVFGTERAPAGTRSVLGIGAEDVQLESERSTLARALEARVQPRRLTPVP